MIDALSIDKFKNVLQVYYPKSEASRKQRDTELLKSIRQKSQIDMQELLEKLDPTFKESVFRKKNVMEFL